MTPDEEIRLEGLPSPSSPDDAHLVEMIRKACAKWNEHERLRSLLADEEGVKRLLARVFAPPKRRKKDA